MAGMGDNPLVGDYTKGISKGPQYWADLVARANRERVSLTRLAPDLEMGLFRSLARRGAKVVLVPQRVPQTRPVAVQKPKRLPEGNCGQVGELPKKRAVVHSLSELKVLFRQF